VVPWGRLEALIAPHYTKPRKGRPQMPLGVMLRIYFLQQRYGQCMSQTRKGNQWYCGARMHVGVDARSGRGLSTTQRKKNRRHGAVRAKVEHVFRVIKYQFGYRKVRYRGLAKNQAQMFSLMALANLCMARRRPKPDSA
jgi:IS5 family transposase